MYKTVRNTVEANGTIWEGIPAVVSTVDHFRQMIQELENLDQDQRLATIGVRAAKDELRAVRIDLLIRLSGALFVLGKHTGNIMLCGQMKINPSHLENCSRQEFLSLVDRIISAAMNHSAELLMFGIQTEEVEQLPVIRQELETSILSTRTATVKKKVLTEQMNNLSRAIDDLLKNELDPLVKMFKGSHPVFINAYLSSRMIINYGNSGANPNAA